MNTASTISINVNARFGRISKVMRCLPIHKTQSHIRERARDRN